MNRKFILIGLLLGACFAFTVLQVATVEAQQCDASLACDPTTGTCCNQCDPGPACVAGDPHAIPCCSSGGNDMSSGTPPQRGSAPPEHDEMSHDRRTDRLPQHKMGGELREKLEECLARGKDAHQPQPRSAQRTPAPNCTGSVQQATSANQALDEICISLNDRINGLQAQVAALPLASDQNMRNFQQASQIAQNNIIRSFQEEVFDQHCPNPGEQ